MVLSHTRYCLGEMAHLVVKRSRSRRDFFRSYAIMVDGAKLASVKSGSASHVRLNEGAHVIYLEIDGFTSPPLNVLTCDQATTVISCKPGLASGQDVLKGRALRASYIQAWVEDEEACIRSYIQMAARAAHRMLKDKDPPGRLSSQGLSAGDVSILVHAARNPDTKMLTSRGSRNDMVWSKMAEVGWLVQLDAPSGPVEMSMFRPTPYGQVELLDLL